MDASDGLAILAIVRLLNSSTVVRAQLCGCRKTSRVPTVWFQLENRSLRKFLQFRSSSFGQLPYELWLLMWLVDTGSCVGLLVNELSIRMVVSRKWKPWFASLLGESKNPTCEPSAPETHQKYKFWSQVRLKYRISTWMVWVKDPGFAVGRHCRPSHVEVKGMVKSTLEGAWTPTLPNIMAQHL